MPDMCCLCGREISGQKGKDFVTMPDGVGFDKQLVHKKCHDDAPRCCQCNKKMFTRAEWKQVGASGRPCHNTCEAAFMEATRPLCTGCGQRILDDEWTTLLERETSKTVTKSKEIPYHNACAPKKE
eukprot:PhF_6_TR34665/c0_g1_i2/m.50435